jgi:CheY-like chemotaxis protein/HPt (histidine-containing phosphotransfer) domain-containing protein
LSEARLLVVDDNATARAILVSMARGCGLEVHEVRDGWDALRALSLAVDSGTPFDLVLLDWKMTAMDGVECAHQIVLQLRGRAPAIVMMSAFGRDELMQQLQAQGVSGGILTKPVTRAALLDASAMALGQVGRSEGRGTGHPVSDSRARLRGAHLLLVEDNLINQELAAELLGDVGITVRVAGNGEEALALLAREVFDGVLMDCQMPVLDGYDTTRALRKNPDWTDLPVIAMTANAMSGDRELALGAGMNDHIAKPINVEAMFNTIARWVRPRRPRANGLAPDPAAAGPIDALATLPGVDAAVGRTSTMGNDMLYRRLLGMFRNGQRDVIEEFRAAYAVGDEAGATRLVHNLRTVSASLGAVGLARASRLLEVACLNGALGLELMRLLDGVALELRPVLDGLDMLLPDAT